MAGLIILFPIASATGLFAAAKPRNIFHLSFGTDNLFHTDRLRIVARFTVLNLSNEASLYNFLSPFSGTHWLQPRAFQAQLGWTF